MKDIVFFTITVLAFASCKKPNCKPQPIEFSDTFLSFFGKVHKDNYWIYSSNNNQTDSVYHTEIETTVWVDRKGNPCGPTTKTLNYVINTKKLIPAGQILRGENSVQTNLIETSLSIYTLGDRNQGQTVYTSQASFSSNTITTQTIILNGMQFVNCVVSTSPYNNYFKMYWQKDIGLVGWTDGQITYNLIRYSIN